jgi:hypothetical protein
MQADKVRGVTPTVQETVTIVKNSTKSFEIIPKTIDSFVGCN